jgi:YD repeat-containing protein
VVPRDRDANALATIAIDRLNGVDQFAYDSKGNITKHTFADLNTDQYTYNSFAEVTQHTDANNHIYNYIYLCSGQPQFARNFRSGARRVAAAQTPWLARAA